MTRKAKPPFDPKEFLSKVNGGQRISDYRQDQTVFRQGEASDAVFYIHSGKAKKTVISEQGKEAVVALLDADDFFGEGCLAGETAASVDGHRADEMHDRANIEGGHHARDP